MHSVLSFITDKHVRGGRRQAKTQPVAFPLKPRLFWV